MTDFIDLENFFKKFDRKLILAADAEPIVHKKEKGKIITQIPAGGVGVALEPIARASNAIYVARGKDEIDKEVLNKNNEVILNPNTRNEFLLKRLFFKDEDFNSYYYGFANQTLWPLCHVAFSRPEFNPDWFEGYKKVNKGYADAIKPYIKQKSLIWINDYQLALVPSFLNKPKDTLIGLFWHIPWPTWEIFRILPQKKEILESLLMCDYIAFHRGYQAQNFIRTVEREFEARVDHETNRLFYKNHATTVTSLPMGIDTDRIKDTLSPYQGESIITTVVKSLLGINNKNEQLPKEKDTKEIDEFFSKNKVILGVDRLDYTKGLKLRLRALSLFFEKNPKYIGNVSYLGVLSPSREKIPAYERLKKEVFALEKDINEKYKRKDWQPIHLVSGVYNRPEILSLYKKAQVALVTPLDDGMNLVSKEFIVAASTSQDPGVLILSQFAGSSIDLTQSLIINPYDIKEVADAIKKALEMPKSERIKTTEQMERTLEERNVYSWAMKFIKETEETAEK
ncbi:MAG TPA: trehalose-6-phosphate synthase [Patescibacteria group bacterium]